MGKLIAVKGATLLQDDVNVVCTITPTGVPSIKNKAESKGFLLDGYSITISAITYPSALATIPDPLTYTATFNSTATKVKDSNTLVLLEGDVTATISANPLIPQPPPAVPTQYPITFKVEITVAGQTKVKAV